MTQKIKRSVSLLLAFMMVVGIFTAMPITASADSGLLYKKVWYFNREYTVITEQPTGFEVVYLQPSGTTAVTATAAEGHTLSYTWYYSTVNSNTGGSWAGNGASCGINTQDYGPGEGTYYFYCVVTATRNDNGQMPPSAQGTLPYTPAAFPQQPVKVRASAAAPKKRI